VPGNAFSAWIGFAVVARLGPSSVSATAAAATSERIAAG
jgi:hypothetical protein